MFCKKGVLRNFAKFTGKHLCQSLFLIKLQASGLQQACNFIKKKTLAQVFSCEFCEISKNTFFTEHLWTTASVFSRRSQPAACNTIKKETIIQVFSCECWEVVYNSFIAELFCSRGLLLFFNASSLTVYNQDYSYKG